MLDRDIDGLEMVCSREITFITVKRRLNNLLDISSNPNSLSHVKVKL